MIRAGALPSKCRCDDPFKDHEMFIVEHHTGSYPVECPHCFITPIAEELSLSLMCVNGTFPVAGGVLDQSAWFLKLHSALKVETGLAREELREAARNEQSRHQL